MPDGTRLTIPFEAYHCLLQLAKEFHIKIPLAIITRFIDVSNASGVGAPIEYAQDLIHLLENNKEYFEVCYHGLTHSHRYSENWAGADRWPANVGEFYKLDLKMRVPYQTQFNHVKSSALVFESLNWLFPKVFVPPNHAWEKGVTDKIVSSFGGEYIASEPKFMVDGQMYSFGASSSYLSFLPRQSLGLAHNEVNFKPEAIKRKVIFDYLRRFSSQRLRFSSSYIVHIANFIPQTYPAWKSIFSHFEDNPLIGLCPSSEGLISHE